jgi:hypothetical protein
METFCYIIPYFFIGFLLGVFVYLMTQSYLKKLKSKNKKEFKKLV